MKHVETVVVSVVIGAGFVASLVLFHRIAVYPIAVATVLPATATIIYMVLRVVGMRSAPLRAQQQIRLIALHVVTFVIGLHVLMVGTLAGVGWARALGPRAPVVLLGVAFVAVGNVLPRLRPNLALGIRTARSLDDARLWSHLHRWAGNGAVTLGLVTCAAGLLLARPLIGPVISVAAIVLGMSVGSLYWRRADD
jgi:uncharacterized membrane protein